MQINIGARYRKYGVSVDKLAHASSNSSKSNMDTVLLRYSV